MEWTLKISNLAIKNLRKLPERDKQHIDGTLIEMQNNPFSGDIMRLRGHENCWRRRVGNYRIFYDLDLDEKLIEITSVKRRNSKTY